jgi:uncharacterized protein YecE (DUF72 family)
MAKDHPEILIGTSGWYYNHWAGLFYPQDLPKHKWLRYYTEHFDTVEINSTFYHQPKASSVKNWYRLAPKNFTYAVKANRYITHIKRLKDASEPLEQFFDNVAVLKDKLGPVLFQLPPSLHKDLTLLRSFLKLLPEKPPRVFEFRHKSWFSDDTYKLLNQSGTGFCIHDLPGVTSPDVITGNIIYIRFHGPTDRYAGSYPKSALKNWAKWINQHLKMVKTVYVYFNNDSNANAVFNAKTLKELLCTL